MLNPTIAISTLNEMIQPHKIKETSKPLQNWQKPGGVDAGQATFDMILGQVERKMRQEDIVKLMT